MRILSALAVLTLVGSATSQACEAYYDCAIGYVCCLQSGQSAGMGECKAYTCGDLPSDLPSTASTYDESDNYKIEPVMGQYEYDQSYNQSQNATLSELEHKVERFVHKNGLKLLGIVAVAYILYKHFFKSPSSPVLPTTSACSCQCGQKTVQPNIQYPVWVPPTVMQQPLVQKEASQMN